MNEYTHLVLHVVLGSSSRRVSSSDDSLVSVGRSLSHGHEQRVRALGEVVKLEHAGGTCYRNVVSCCMYSYIYIYRYT